MKHYLFFLIAFGMLLSLEAQNTVTVYGQVDCGIQRASSVTGTVTRPDGTTASVTTDSMGAYADTFSTSLSQGTVVVTFPNLLSSTFSRARNFSPGNYNLIMGIIETCDTKGCRAHFSTSPSAFMPGPLNIDFMDMSYQGDIFAQQYDLIWNFGDGATSSTNSTNTITTHSYAQSGVYHACLIIINPYGCTDTICKNVVVGNTPGGCLTGFSAAPGSVSGSFDFTSYSVGLGSQATNTYLWTFGDGNTSTQANPTHTYATTGRYNVCLEFTSSDTTTVCRDTFCNSMFVRITPNASISGEVYRGSGIAADSALVYLIRHDSVAGTLTAIDSTYSYGVGPGGAPYSFTSLPTGSYRTKAALLPGHSQYANYLPTYHDSVLFWNTASVINLGANATATADIFMQAGNNPGGPGFIGGLISQGANKRDPGDPLENISVLLLDNNDQPVTHTLSDLNGAYGFNDLPYGTYRVHVEVLNRISTDQYITISAVTSSATDINFDVNSTTVDVTTAIQEFNFGRVLEIFPNPTTGLLQVTLELSHGVDLDLSVVDIIGKTKKHLSKKLGPGEQGIVLDISDLSKGIYILYLSSGDQLISRKIIKE